MKRTFKGSKSTDYLRPYPTKVHECTTCGRQLTAYRICTGDLCSRSCKGKVVYKGEATKEQAAAFRAAWLAGNKKEN